MKKIIELEIINSPNKLENGKRYLKQTEGTFTTQNINMAMIHTRENKLKNSLKWIEKFNAKHSDYCILANVKAIDLETF